MAYNGGCGDNDWCYWLIILVVIIVMVGIVMTVMMVVIDGGGSCCDVMLLDVSSLRCWLCWLKHECMMVDDMLMLVGDVVCWDGGNGC